MPGEVQQPTAASTSESGSSVDEVEAISVEAVRILGVARAVQAEADILFPRIEECDSFAEGAPVNADMMFLALSLPIANGLIHFATSRQKLNEARDWVWRRWKGQADEPDPISTLAALTLVYIIDQGWRHFKDVPEKRKIWQRIRTRVEKLADDPPTAPFTAPSTS